MQSSSVLRRYKFKIFGRIDKPIRAGSKVMPLVAVITVLGRRLDVALAFAAILPRIFFNPLGAFFSVHIVSPK